MLIAGILVLDAGVQGLQVTNQSIIYRLAPEVHSRINSAYMVCYFVGGALGSAAASAIYDSSHWAGICVLGAAIGIVATALAVYDQLTRHAATTDQAAGADQPAGPDELGAAY